MKDDSLRDKVALYDILQIIAEIEYLLTLTERNKVSDRALERCFEIMGESCRRISQKIQQQYPSIPWGNIISLRNMITHEYDKVKIDTLWDIAEHKIPALKDWIKGIIVENNFAGTSGKDNGEKK